MNDAYKKMLEQLNDPFRGLNLIQDSFSKIKIAESLALRPHEQMMKSIVDRENWKMQLIQPHLDTQEMLKKILSSMKNNEPIGIQKVMESIKSGYVGNFGLDTSVSVSIQKMIKESSALNGSIAAAIKQLEPFGEDLRRALNSANNLPSMSALSSMSFDVSGNLQVNENAVSSDEFKDGIDELSEITSSFEGTFEQLIARIKNCKPLLQWIFCFVIIPYLVSIIANMHSPWWEKKWTEYSDKGVPGVKKAIRTDARECFVAGALDNCRFVTAKKLVVRVSANARSKMLYSMKFGVVIKLLSKDKDWSLIEYRDDDSNTIEQGWVFSRHLAKFE